MSYPPLDTSRLHVGSVTTRHSLLVLGKQLVDPDSPAPEVSPELDRAIAACARSIQAARAQQAAILVVFGAHLIRNGAGLILDRMMAQGWATHLATNGAGSIHDWEFSWLGRTCEHVETQVAAGRFGSWDETGRALNLALLVGGLRGEGYGRSLGRFIAEEGLDLPVTHQLELVLREFPTDRLAPACADLLLAMRDHDIPAGRWAVPHVHKAASLFARAFERDVPMTVHPGIGYDIIVNHPLYNGAAVGRAAAVDYRQFAATVDRLDNGVVLSIGSAIMGPQVFEKALSCAHNLRFQQGRPAVVGHTIHVVDLQDGGGWDWSTGEPPKSNAAYYLRFCKSYSRMGGAMFYHQADNITFLHRLLHHLMAGS